MCICVNCQFYSNCWINDGLMNFPLNYQTLIDNIVAPNKIKDNKKLLIYLPVTLDIQLNVNSINYSREPDIIYCDAFIEKPGSWLM